ncbi:ASCH domain-containing protein [bacterium]|nr:ASCH domain-containing protein [bacterium]
MNFYVQYHNVQNEGLPISNPPFGETRLSIHTRRSNVQEADGRVFLIVGVGRPRRFFLWESFDIEEVTTRRDVVFRAIGTGWQLAPPIELKGKQFDEFKEACARFVGFRCINGLPYSRKLAKLVEENRPPGEPNKIVTWLKELLKLVGDDSQKLAVIRHSLGFYEAQRALSIRQPHAEAIMREIKRIEYRSGPTKVRGRIFIYASKGRYSEQDESKWMKKYRITDINCDDLPRGMLIGTVELFDCDGGQWHLRRPERASKLVPPINQPQPIWFYPF